LRLWRSFAKDAPAPAPVNLEPAAAAGK
jgi:hypothetical protein